MMERTAVMGSAQMANLYNRASLDPVRLAASYFVRAIIWIH